MNTREIKTVSQIVTALTEGGNTLAMRLGAIRAAHVRIVVRDHGMTATEAEQSFAACRIAAEDQIVIEAQKAAEVAEELKEWACKCSVCAPAVTRPSATVKGAQFVIVDEATKKEILCTDWGHVGTWLVKLGYPAKWRRAWMKNARELLNYGFYGCGFLNERYTLKMV